MGCGASKGPVPTLGQLQKDGALMEWVDARTAEGTFPTDWEGKKIVKAELVGKHVEGGYMGHTRRCTLTFDDGSTKDAFMKLSKDDMQSAYYAKMLELTREASFFNTFKKNGIQFEHMKLPEVYIACSDGKTYRNILIMGYIEGSQNLWQLFGDFKYKSRPDLDRPMNIAGQNVVAIDMARKVARAYGEFHGSFWMDKTFLAENKSWIHAADYFAGENLKGYEKMIGEFKTGWKVTKAGLHPGTCIHKWDKQHNDVIDACLKKSTAEEFKKHYQIYFN